MGSEKSEHKDRVVKSFARQARSYIDMPIARSAENVAPMIDLSMPGPFDEALDLGCGAGFVGMAFGPYVKKITGIDLSPEMIESAKKIAADRGVKNIEFQVGDVEDMPFPRGAFDIVVCRFTFHHFENPQKVLAEIKRVTRPMSRVVIYDMVSPADDTKAAFHNEIERVRDPSHVRMLQDKEWRDMFEKSGFDVRAKISVLMKRDFDPWMDIVEADDALRGKVSKMMEKAADKDSAGMGVRIRKGKINFTHTCAIWLAVQK